MVFPYQNNSVCWMSQALSVAWSTIHILLTRAPHILYLLSSLEKNLHHSEFQMLQSFCRLPRWHGGKKSAHQWRRHRRYEFNPWVRKTSWSRKWQPTPLFLPGKLYGQRSQTLYCLWCFKGLNTAEWLCTHAHMYSIISSAKSDGLTSFPIWIPFISFSSLIPVSGTFKTMLNKSGESGPFFLFLISEEMLSYFHH